MKLINDTLFFDNTTFIRRDRLFNRLLVGKYELYDSANNFLEELEINEDGSIDNGKYISDISICDYVKNWNWVEWMTPLIDNADFARVALVNNNILTITLT
ncbi:hypothetical protein V6R21_19810 [Limibacter armeniacum]|uniref:hypothetical protein n=1 Tax=Limibacter armeniacum TaxID=466084 RepID=UPI002FE571B9